jgi:hypothetical protein
VSFQLMPAAFHDLTPLHESAVVLPPGARLYDDKAYNSALDERTILDETGVRLIPVRRANMQPHDWFLDDIELRDYRHTIETVNSQCEKMGLERLYAHKSWVRAEGIGNDDCAFVYEHDLELAIKV